MYYQNQKLVKNGFNNENMLLIYFCWSDEQLLLDDSFQ